MAPAWSQPEQVGSGSPSSSSAERPTGSSFVVYERSPSEAPPPAASAPRSPGEDFRAAVALLRSSDGHYFQVWASFLVSAGMTADGIRRMEMSSIAPMDRSFALLALAFLTSQAFTLAKTVRDRATADLPHAPAGAEFLRGTGAWYLQVLASFGLALGGAGYGFCQMQVSVERRIFLCMGGLFTLGSALNLAKTLRDRIDADTWRSQGEAQLPNLLTVARGTVANRAQVWAAFGLSLLGTLGGLGVLDMAEERRGFLVMGLLFMTASAFHLAKAVRDRDHPEKAPTLPVMGLCVSSLLVSTAATYAGLYRMPLNTDQIGFVALGAASTLSAAFNVAKLLRDGEELGKLKHD